MRGNRGKINYKIFHPKIGGKEGNGRKKVKLKKKKTNLPMDTSFSLVFFVLVWGSLSLFNRWNFTILDHGASVTSSPMLKTFLSHTSCTLHNPLSHCKVPSLYCDLLKGSIVQSIYTFLLPMDGVTVQHILTMWCTSPIFHYKYCYVNFHLYLKIIAFYSLLDLVCFYIAWEKLVAFSHLYMFSYALSCFY